MKTKRRVIVLRVAKESFKLAASKVTSDDDNNNSYVRKRVSFE
jgi:hypothetical protein